MTQFERLYRLASVQEQRIPGTCSDVSIDEMSRSSEPHTNKVRKLSRPFNANFLSRT